MRNKAFNNTFKDIDYAYSGKWVTCSPTILPDDLAGNTINAWERRVFDTWEMNCKVVFGQSISVLPGAWAADSNGLTRGTSIDTSKIQTTDAFYMGFGSFYDSSSSDIYAIKVINAAFRYMEPSTMLWTPFGYSTASFQLGQNDVLQFNVKAPFTGWGV